MRRGAGGIEVETVSGRVESPEVSQAHTGGRLALYLDLRGAFAVFRATVAQVFGVVVMIAALRGNLLPIKFGGLEQGAFRLFAGDLSFNLPGTPQREHEHDSEMSHGITTPAECQPGRSEHRFDRFDLFCNVQL